MPDGIVLSEQDRARLDGIVQKMIANKESDENIKFVVEDFKNKYGLKKKEPTASSGQTEPKASTTKTQATSTSSDTEQPTRAQASVGSGGPTKTFRLAGESDLETMQKRGILPPPSSYPRTKVDTNNLYGSKSNFNKDYEELKAYLGEGNYKQRLETLPKDKKTKKAEDLYTLKQNSTEHVDSINEIANLKKKIQETDSELENPYVYYSVQKQKENPDNFLNENYNTKELLDLGINLEDFDGFLNKKGYKYDFIKKKSKGFFEGEGKSLEGYDIDLAEELSKKRMLDLYIEDKYNRDFIKQDLNQDILIASGDIKEKSIQKNQLFDQKKILSYIEKHFPVLTKKLKERDEENAKLYEEAKKGGTDFFSWDTVSKIGKAGWNSLTDRINQFTASGYDILGAEDTAEGIRMLDEQEKLLRPNDRGVSYVSGKKINDNGVNYIVDSKGDIYDADSKIIVTDLFNEQKYKNLVEKSKYGEDDWIFSTQGAAVQTSAVVTDMLFQAALTKGIGTGGSIASEARGLFSGVRGTSKVASVLNDTSKILRTIPIDRSTGYSMIAQGALGYSQGYEDTLKAAREAGINDKDAFELAANAGQRMALLYSTTGVINPQTNVVENVFGSKNIIKKAIEQYTKTGKKGFVGYIDDLIKNTPRNLVDFAEEGGKEVIQENIQQVGELGVNKITNLDAGKKIMNEVMSADDFMNTSILSFISSGLISKAKMPTLFRSDSKDDLKSLSVLSKNRDKVDGVLNDLLSKQVFTKEQVDNLKQDVDIYTRNVGKLPKKISADIAMPIMRELDKINKLNEEKKNVDKVFHDDIDNQISSIENNIKELYKSKETSEVKEMSVKPAEALKDVESTATALGNLDTPWFDDFQNNFGEEYKTTNDVSEAYHKAKADGNNPELVKAVEELIGKPTEVKVEEVKPTEVKTVTYNNTEYSKNEAGNWVNTKTGNEVKGIGETGKELIKTLDELAAPTEEVKTATEEIAPSEIETTLDEVIVPASKDIKEQISRAKRAISKLLPNVEIVYHTTAESYKSAVGDNSRGYYEGNTIHINGSNANSRTVAHEVFHAVILKNISSNKQATDLTNKMLKAVSKSLKGKKDVVSEINKFVEQGYSEDLWSEEKLAEVIGYLASEYETLPDVSKNIIQKWIEKIAKMVGIKKFTDQEVVDFMNAIATKVSTGQEITETDVKAINQGVSTYIAEPTEINRYQKVKEEKVKVGDHKLSFVKQSDIINFDSLLKDISDKKQKVWFWVADQLGRGNYYDSVIDGEHYLDAGPSFALDPENRSKNVIWATGKPEKEITKLINSSDYIFIISGSPLKSKLFNKSIIDIISKRAGDFNSFKKNILRVSKIKPLNDVLSSVNSWEQLRDTPNRKEFLLNILNQADKNTPLKKELEKYNAIVDLNELRDGFYADNNFDINDIMLVLKPTGFGGKSNHSTYENDILGEIVGVPDIKVDAFDIMPSEIKDKYKKDLTKSMKQQVVAPYGIGVKPIERKKESVKGRKQILGENAKLSQDIRDNLGVARNMELLKKSDKEIRLATGWERGADKKWRYEIPDNIPFLKDTVKTVGEFLSENKGTNQLSQKANYFLPKELLDLYPELNDVTIKFDNKGDESEGSYDTETKTIEVSIGVYPSKTVSSLIHEVQHAIQEIEGFAEGGSLSSSAKLAILSLEKKLGKRIESTTRKEMLSLKLNKEEENFRTFILNSFYKAKNQKQLLNLIDKESYNIYKKLIGEVEARNVERRMNATPEARRRNTLRETEDVAREDQIIFFKERTPKVSERKQISPENSSNYAHMTEDGNGNFVFYHYGPRGIESIDPKKYGSNKGAITSKPEIAAMGRVGGMSQYYTKPEYSEHNVTGDKYMIKVPMSKVYDFNTDPENFIQKAKEIFKRRHPDLPFTANDQLAHITKLAEKAGYDMTVAEWNNMSRAQSTKPLKPVDVQVMDGNVITKPFKENYESNSTKGFVSVVPTSKEAKLKDVYEKINAERNAENRYDSLYSLAEDFPKLSQDEITAMIEKSDISKEMKDAYAEALAYEPGARMSGRRQINTDEITNNTKAEVDSLKKLPLKEENGATFNLDGTKYEGGGLVVPVKSLEGNTTQDKISPEMIADFAKNNEDKIGDDEIVKLGIYKFPDSDTVSIDMNIVIPNEHRDVALEFGKLIGQESLFDLDTFENIKTGADGLNPMNLTAEQFREAAASLKNGVMPVSVSGRRQLSPIDEAVKVAKNKGFNDKDIADYLVGKGYTRAQATKAILRYNEFTAVKLRKEDSVFTKEGRNKIVTFLDQVKRRAFSARSFLPKSVFLQREKIESNIKAEAKRASYLVDDFNRLVKKYKGDVDELNNEFDKYLRGDQTANIPDEFKAVAGKMRIHIDNLSQMLLRTGAVSVSQAETIAANLGQYINRSYQVFDKKDWAKQVTEEMKEAARVDLRNMYRAEAESKAKQTGMDADIILDDFINKKIDELISGESAATFLGVGKTGAKNLGIMKQRLDIPLSIRQLMGEYTDASQNYARTVLKIATLAENARFLQSAREAGMGVFFYNENDPNRPKEFNTKIAGDKSDTMSPLNGLYTTPEIAKAFTQKIGTGDAIEAALGTEFGPIVKSMYETYMKALSSVKWLKTIGSVATHAKNVTGNIWFMLSNGYYNPKKYAEAFKVLKNSSNEQLRNKLDEYIRAGIIDQSAALGEIKAMFSDADFETAIDSRLKKNPFQKAKSGVKKLGQKMSTAYQLEDDFFKIISYESEKNRYANAYFDKSFDELTNDQKDIVKNYASEITKNILPNYSRIPGLVKLLKAVPVTGTFVSFQAEAYRTAWNTVALAADELKSDNKKVRAIGAKRLAGIAASQAAKLGLMALMGTIVSGGGDDDDDDLKKNTKLFIAPWSKDSDIVLVEYGKGKMSYIDFSASDPHGGIKKAYNSVMSGKSVAESFANGLTQLLEPFMKEDMLFNVITDIKDNKNSYGGKLYNESDTDVNKINAIMERVYKAFEPGTITSVRKVVGSDDVRNELMGQLTGYKINTVDVNKQLGFKMNELKDLSGEAKKLYSSAFYKFEDGVITGDELDKIYNQANESQKEVYKKMIDYMNAASFFGVEDYLIEDNMQGVGKSVINDLWYGDTPDMKMKEPEE